MAAHIFDQRFSENKLRYFLQCLLATVSAVLVLLVLDTMANKVVMALTAMWVTGRCSESSLAGNSVI